MTTRKKIFSIILCFVLILTLGFGMLSIVMNHKQNTCEMAAVSATDEVDAFEQNEGGEALAEPNKNDKTETHTFLSRMWEFIETYYPEIAATIGNIIVMIMLIVYNVKSKKKLLNIDSTVIKQSETQSDIIEVINGLIGGYNSLETKLSKYNATEDERYVAVGAMVVQTKAILDILTTVYANSKNIPQGVKDLVNLKYANVLKIVEDTDRLKEIAVEDTQQAEELKESNMEV